MRDCTKEESKIVCHNCGDRLMPLIYNGRLNFLDDWSNDDGDYFCCEDCLNDYENW